MPRAPRIHIERGLYYTLSKAQTGQQLFTNEGDYAAYLALVERYRQQYGFTLHCQALLPQEAHLLIELGPSSVIASSLPFASLRVAPRNDDRMVTISKIMHDINSNYTKYYNTKHSRKGHLFKGRYRVVLVEKERYLETVKGYIEGIGKDKEGIRMDREGIGKDRQLAEKLQGEDIVGSSEFVKGIRKDKEGIRTNKDKRRVDKDEMRVRPQVNVLAVALIMLSLLGGVAGYMFIDYLTAKKDLKVTQKEEERLFGELKKAQIKRMVLEYRKEELEKRFQKTVAGYLLEREEMDKEGIRKNKEL